MGDWKKYLTARLPLHMHEGVILYVEKHVRPGSFLCAVFANDLVSAVQGADEINRFHLDSWTNLALMVPSECRGMVHSKAVNRRAIDSGYLSEDSCCPLRRRLKGCRVP